MNKLRLGLVSLASIVALSFNNSCTSTQKIISLEKSSQRSITDEKWDDLVRKAELESDTLMMQDTDIINLLTKYNLTHYYMDPFMIPCVDTLGNQLYHYIYGYATSGSNNLLLINDFIDEDRPNSHITLTVVHELMHAFYWSMGMDLSEPEISARAWVWYKRKFIKNNYITKEK